jgi:hypothetical protein
MDKQLLQKLADVLAPMLKDTLERKPLTSTEEIEIKKEDPTTWPPELHEAWEKCCAECKNEKLFAPVDTGSSSDDGM